MVTKSQIKQIKQLKYKKYREKTGLFVAEGKKIVLDLLKANLDFIYVFTTKINFGLDSHVISKKDMISLTHFKNGSDYLGVFVKPSVNHKMLNKNRTLIALDEISDPGNLGNIIRTCDWFGVNHIICSKNSVDCYNPKVIQSSMGSLSRVNIIYTDILKFLQSKNLPIYAADIEGQKIGKSKISDKCIWLFGSESHGISQKIKKLVDISFTIPKYNQDVKTESLNLATSLAIILSYSRI